jgi:hypothetical protein
VAVRRSFSGHPQVPFERDTEPSAAGWPYGHVERSELLAGVSRWPSVGSDPRSPSRRYEGRAEGRLPSRQCSRLARISESIGASCR